jgi:hypothetical protein
MSYSRRQLYALGEPLGDSATYRKASGGLVFGDGGGGGGSSQPSNQTSSTTQTQDLPDWAKPYAQDVLSKGKAITDINQNPYQPYGGERVAGFSNLQNQSQTNAANIKTGPEGFQQDVSGYMNPYMNQILAPRLAEANRQYDISGMNANAQATQAGAFGGGRQALMQAENERNRNMGLQSIYGQGLDTAFGNAQNQYNQGFGQNMQAIGLQNQMGGQQQAQTQRGLDVGYQDFLTQKNYPYQQLSYMANLVRGTPMGMNTQSQVYQSPPNTLGQLGGLGMGAYGLSKMMAEGGEVKSYAGGGDTPDPMNDPYKMASKVDMLTDDQLQAILQHPSSPAEYRAAQDEMAMRASEQRGVASAVTPEMANRMASGGIIAFKDKGYVEGATGDDLDRYQAQTDAYLQGAKIAAADRDAAEPLDVDSEARFTTPPTSTPLSRAGESIKSGLGSITSALGSKKIPGMKFDSEDSALEENVRLANLQKQPGSGSTLNAVPVKETLPSGAKTPAEYDKELAGRKDLDKKQKESMSGMYSNGYKQFEQPTKPGATKPVITAGGATRPAGTTSKEPSFIDDLKTAQAFLRDPESEARAKKVEASIEALKKQPDEIKKQGLANFLVAQGAETARQASMPGVARGRGILGALQSFSAAAPVGAQSVMDTQKLMRASQENAAKLDIEYQKYRIAESKGDKQAMVSTASNIRMMRQQQMQLDEAKRHNQATEGIQGQSLSLQQKKLDAVAENHARYIAQIKSNTWNKSVERAAKDWAIMTKKDKEPYGNDRNKYVKRLYDAGMEEQMPQLQYLGTLGGKES